MNAREVISIFYPDSKARLGELQVDAFIRESHAFSNDISEHPIESGGAIVDHIHNKAVSLSLDGIISNTPMSLLGLTAIDSANRFLSKESNNFAEMAFKKIEELFLKREPIVIATSLKTYANMVLEGLSIERGGGLYDSLMFTCTAKQIQIVSQNLIAIPQPKAKRAQPKQKKGLQETKTVPESEVAALKETNKSALASVRDAIGDGLGWVWKKF
jgi:hypothetical protein